MKRSDRKRQEQINLPYYGKKCREMQHNICYKCQHYGCTDSIEVTCQGFVRADRITMFFRNLWKRISG